MFTNRTIMTNMLFRKPNFWCHMSQCTNNFRLQTLYIYKILIRGDGGKKPISNNRKVLSRHLPDNTPISILIDLRFFGLVIVFRILEASRGNTQMQPFVIVKLNIHACFSLTRFT